MPQPSATAAWPTLATRLLTATCWLTSAGSPFFRISNSEASSISICNAKKSLAQSNENHYLTSITCLATSGINTNNSTNWWVNGVASSGTFTRANGASWPTGFDGIPSNWTIVDR